MRQSEPCIVFAGTPQFAASHLEALVTAGFNIVSVYSQPDRPAGRGKKLQPTPVKAVAQAHGLPVAQPPQLNTPEALAALAALRADVMVVVAYGLLLPESVLQLPRLGCINVHASLLPRWRGAAPIERALMAGDEQTGVTIMQMEPGLDTGPMLLSVATPITPEDNSATLSERLCRLGCGALCEALRQLPDLLQQAEPQDEALATYARKIGKEEARIDWRQSAAAIHNTVRALYPRAPAYTLAASRRLRLIRTSVPGQACDQTPGTVLDLAPGHIDVACAGSVLRIHELQPEGKNAMSVQSFLNGYAQLLQPGALLDGQ